MPCQGGFDLAGFDAEAADLHLFVDPAHEVEPAVGGPPDPVARAVHPAARLSERIRDEPVRRQARPVEIAARELRAGEAQLTGCAGRYRRQGVVEDVGSQVAQRAPDRRPVPGHRRAGGVHCGLGGAVVVVGRRVGRRQLAPQVLADRFAGDHQESRPSLAVEQPRREQLAGIGRRHVQEVDPLFPHIPRQRGGIETGVVVEDVHLVAVGHGEERLPRGVERERRHQRRTDPRPGKEGPAVVAEQVHQCAVLDHDALGRAGGAGGVDDVGRVVRLRLGGGGREW